MRRPAWPLGPDPSRLATVRLNHNAILELDPNGKAVGEAEANGVTLANGRWNEAA